MTGDAGHDAVAHCGLNVLPGSLVFCSAMRLKHVAQLSAGVRSS